MPATQEEITAHQDKRGSSETPRMPSLTSFDPQLISWQSSALRRNGEVFQTGSLLTFSNPGTPENAALFPDSSPLTPRTAAWQSHSVRAAQHLTQ